MISRRVQVYGDTRRRVCTPRPCQALPVIVAIPLIAGDTFLPQERDGIRGASIATRSDRYLVHRSCFRRRETIRYERSKFTAARVTPLIISLQNVRLRNPANNATDRPPTSRLSLCSRRLTRINPVTFERSTSATGLAPKQPSRGNFRGGFQRFPELRKQKFLNERCLKIRGPIKSRQGEETVQLAASRGLDFCEAFFRLVTGVLCLLVYCGGPRNVSSTSRAARAEPGPRNS